MSMDARLLKGAVTVCLVLSAHTLAAGTFQTRNFTVNAPTDEIAQQVGEAAEFWRKELAQLWLAQSLPDWSRPCPIQVKVGQIGAGGATTFTFENGEVFGWKMNVQGSLERILDSVIPHEVNHTVFATYFRRPLPRWADEGAATLVEHESERLRQTRLLNQVIRTSRRIPLNELLQIREYPEDMQQVLTLYAEGYALADFLVQQHPENGRFIYLHFLQTAQEQGWDAAIRKYYRFKSVAELEGEWTGWVMAGSPALLPEGQMLASTDTSRSNDESEDLVVRGQTPTEPEPLPMLRRSLRQEQPARRDLFKPTSYSFESGTGDLRSATQALFLPSSQDHPHTTADRLVPNGPMAEEFRWMGFPATRE